MAEHAHDTAGPERGAPRAVRRVDASPAHPLLDLQQQAGNAAVGHLLALQRHTLDPEEEEGG